MKLRFCTALISPFALILALSASAETRYISSEEGLRVRKEADTDSEVLVVLPYGTEIDTDDEYKDDEWLKVTHDETEGYVLAEYTQETNPLDGLEDLGVWRTTAYAATGMPCANGNYPEAGYTVAHNSLPFGTRLYIEGIGVRIVEDRGPGYLGTEWCDIFMSSVGECMAWGDRNVHVWKFPD